MIRELTTDDGAFASSQDADTEGDRGADLHLARGRGPRGAGAGGGRPVRRGLRRDRRGQLGGRDDPVAHLAGRRRAAVPGRRGARGRARPSPGPACWSDARHGRSRRATTRRWRPGTGWRSRPSPRRGGCSGRSATRPRRSGRRRRSSTGCSAEDGSLKRSWKDGRAVGARRARGLRPPRGRPAGAVRDDLRRALVHDRPRASPTGSWRTSPTRPAASSTRRATTRRSSPGPRTRRTTRSRRAGRWRRPCCCGWPPGPGRGDIAKPRNGRSARSRRSWRATRRASPNGSSPRRSRPRTSSRWRSSATRPTARPASCSGPSGRRGGRPGARGRAAGCGPDAAVPLLHDRVAVGGTPTAYVCRGFVCRLPVTDPAALVAQLRARARYGRLTTIAVPAVLSPSGSWFSVGS